MKSFHYILFDLDGTLLPMDQDEFTRYYFGFLCRKLAPYGYDPAKLVDAIWSGTAAMVANDGKLSNEKAFWKKFATHFDFDVVKDEPLFVEFYRNEFNKAEEVCGKIDNIQEVIDKLKQYYHLILATNPIFPSIATENRIRWAGLNKDDFEIITTYENSTFCKPNTEYYREILSEINAQPKECLMVGNDIDEDGCVRKIGMDFFLLTRCLINKNSEDISGIPYGDLDDLLNYLEIE